MKTIAYIGQAMSLLAGIIYALLATDGEKGRNNILLAIHCTLVAIYLLLLVDH